ncbi:60S ribosomal protein L18a [Lemmus lemmus]
MRIFALNHEVAKSHFWYFLSPLKKMKESSGETVCCGRCLRSCYCVQRSLASGYAGTHSVAHTICTMSTGT